MINFKEYRLCYVKNNIAYFTTQHIEKQEGDDWNDVPYEHNAGAPYDYQESSRPIKWRILEIEYSADLNTPDYGHTNSPYSVQDINKGSIAWLQSPSYVKDGPVRIFAGTSLGEFIATIKDIGGKVYFKFEI